MTPAEAERLIDAGRSGPDLLQKAIGKAPLRPMRLPCSPRQPMLCEQLEQIEAMVNQAGCVWRRVTR